MALPKELIDAARDLLVVSDESGRPDLWLWERAERVMNLAQMIAVFPEVREVGDDPPDLAAVAAAGLFADAGWAIQVRQGEVDCWRLLGRPTNEIQRELGVSALNECARTHLSADSLEIATQAIRECNERYTRLPEARALAEAENLDDIGIMYVLRQFRQHQSEGRPLEQLVLNWSRQVEYRYWEARINDCLRWEFTRHLARERLKSVEQLMLAVARDRDAADLKNALNNAGIEFPQS